MRNGEKLVANAAVIHVELAVISAFGTQRGAERMTTLCRLAE
jgi:hypothetical protein